MRFEPAIIDEAGALPLSEEVRRALAVGPGDRVVLRLIDGTLRVMSYEENLRRIQEAFRPYAPTDGTRVSDELIAERRAEAARE